MRNIFAIARGQYGNIGDIVLRRQLLDWVREAGPLHVYVGASPDGYDEGLRLQPDDHVYRSLRSWYRAALASAWRGEAAYVFKPGEIQLTIVGLKEHISMLPLLAVLRVRGGRAVRAGVGTRNFAPLPRALMRPSIALSDVTLWRDDATGAYMGTGAVMPDLAFGEGASDEALCAFSTGAGRDALVISMRGDAPGRPGPSPQAIEGITAYAAAHGLTIWVVTQVEVDDEYSRELAVALGGQVLDWRTATGHDRQERVLRELYARTSLVLSDRLHVAIAAFTEGAVPVAALCEPSTKLARHFSTIGLEDVVLDLASTSADAVSSRLDELAGRREQMFDVLRLARARLDVHRENVLSVLSGPRPTASVPVRHLGGLRPTVYHLGRVGDVAGGMTQVLNGYLDWTFPRVDVEVITSRGEPHDIVASLRCALKAAALLMRLDRRSSVVVAHLSGQGSFLREGALLRLASLRGVATVAHLHGSSFATFAGRHPRLTRWVLGAADRVVTLSEESTQVATLSSPPERVRLVPNAIAPGSPGRKSRTVVFGGSVSHRKGIDVLQEAWVALDAPDWELLVAGPVKDAHLVRDDISGVRMLGPLAHDELMSLLDASSVAVLPSREEAMPMFVLEAMARGNAVVSTDVGGIADVLGEGRGIVVPPGDVDALRAALQRVVSDDAERARLASRAADAFEERFSAARMFPRIEDLWLEALAAH